MRYFRFQVAHMQGGAVNKTYEILTSLHNPKVKKLVKLRNRRERDLCQQFLVEGYRELTRAAQGQCALDSLFICPELFLGENEWTLIEQIQQTGVSIFQCSETVFRKISYRDRPDGLIAIARQEHLSLQDLEKILGKLERSPFLLVAESIEKPGNLGTILSSLQLPLD